MKKIFCIALSIVLSSLIFSQQLPETFFGIWEGKDRYVFFDNYTENQIPELVVCLKQVFGWHIDRTAEPDSYGEREQRVRNMGTTRKSEHVWLSVNKELCLNGEELTLKYSNHQINYVPAYILDGNMYLDFYIRSQEDPNFYIGHAVSKGLMMSEQSIPENIACYYIIENRIYNIRYWKTDIELEEEDFSKKASFTYGDDSFFIPSYISSQEFNYSCVTGRSKRVRNSQKAVGFNETEYIWNEDKSVMIFDKEPYLVQLADKNTFEDLMEIIRENNKRRYPLPKPPLPIDESYWEWELVFDIESPEGFYKEFSRRMIDFGTRRQKN